MRRKKRLLEVFGISAVDLFASALGSFVIFMAILIPYYPNMKDGGIKVQRLAEKIQETEQKTSRSAVELKRIDDEILKRKRLTSASKDAEREKSRIVARTRKVRARNAGLESRIAALSGTLEKLRTERRARTRQKRRPAGETGFSILGITTKAKSFVIVADLSGSMSNWSHIMVNTLNELIEPFHKKIRFAIVGFQNYGVTRYWPARGRMAYADTMSKASASYFINKLPSMFRGSTPTKAALLRALSYRPDALILVSDGAPTDERPGAIIEAVTRLNRNKVEIHTVAIGDYLKNSELILFLNELAKKNKGKFVGVIR